MEIKILSNTIWVATKFVDFRKAVDGLCQIIVEDLESRPTDGIYVFYNRNRNRLKLIAWHRNGFVLLYKRFETGRFVFKISTDLKSIKIDEKQLSWLLAGLDWQSLSDWPDLTFDDYF